LDEPRIGGLAFVRKSKYLIGCCEALSVEHRLGAAADQL